MDTHFGFFNSNKTVIHDWHQLLNLHSSLTNVTCSVNDISDDICSATSITIYNKQTNFNYITFFVSGDDSSLVNISTLIYTPDDAINILSLFGYSVLFDDKINLTDKTATVLSALQSLGYNFICKNSKNIIYASQFSDHDLILETGMMVTDVMPASIDCDFSFMAISTVYSIEELLAEH